MKSFKCADLLVGDVLLFIPCFCLTRIIKQITPRFVYFHDGGKTSIGALSRQLSKNMYEITRNGILIFPE